LEDEIPHGTLKVSEMSIGSHGMPEPIEDWSNICW